MIKLLIVDDHAVFRSGLRALLQTETGMTVVAESANGEEALRQAMTTEVDVMTLDLSMPGINSSQVARDLAREKPKLGIVVLTMHEDEIYLNEMLRSGVMGYVLKKSSSNILVQAIHAAAAGRHFVDPALSDFVLNTMLGGSRKRESLDGIDALTPREREVCQLLAYGFTNSEIGEQLCISERTVESHRNSLHAKLNLRNRAAIVRFAINHGLLKTD